jgi:serine/threonine protein kinase
MIESALANFENMNASGLNSDFIEKICKEVCILKDLEHPNIIKYYTSFVENDFIYIVMELLDGPSLADYIQS